MSHIFEVFRATHFCDWFLFDINYSAFMIFSYEFRLYHKRASHEKTGAKQLATQDLVPQ